MLGLRTQESSEFERFMEIVQQAAHEKGATFFLDTSLGNETVFRDMECDNLTGWLIPENEANQFLLCYDKWDTLYDIWEEKYVAVSFSINDEILSVRFS